MNFVYRKLRTFVDKNISNTKESKKSFVQISDTSEFMIKICSCRGCQTDWHKDGGITLAPGNDPALSFFFSLSFFLLFLKINTPMFVSAILYFGVIDIKVSLLSQKNL